jgi:lipoate-protein ligase A
MRIRLLHTPARDGAANMALDDALLDHARAAGEVVVRVYTWAAPTLSFGRNQRAAGVYDAGRLAARGVGAVRRPTGGRAVLHAREVTYSVAAPAGALAPAGAPVRASYGRINLMLVAALRALGVDARVAAPSARAPRPDAGPCFEAPTGGELVVGDGAAARKLAGSAQWQEDGALLQHGSILVDDDQTRLAALAASPTAPVPAPATLRAALGRAPADAEVAAAIFAAAHCLAVDSVADVSPLGEADRRALDGAADARHARYADPAWTWRR